MKYLILLAILVLAACANPSPVDEADPVHLPSLGFEAARIAAEVGIIF